MAHKSEVGKTLSAVGLSAVGSKVMQAARKSTKTATSAAATKSVQGPVQGNIVESTSARSRHEAIALEAWVRAEKRGFAAGDPVADWLEAEKAVDARLAAAHGHRTAA